MCTQTQVETAKQQLADAQSDIHGSPTELRDKSDAFIAAYSEIAANRTLLDQRRLTSMFPRYNAHRSPEHDTFGHAAERRAAVAAYVLAAKKSLGSQAAGF